MVPRSSKVSACIPSSKSSHIASNLNQDHEGCGVSHAKSHMPKVPIKRTFFDKQNDFRTDGNLSPQMAPKVLQVLLQSVAWRTPALATSQQYTFPLTFFLCLSWGAILALPSCEAFLTWNEKSLNIDQNLCKPNDPAKINQRRRGKKLSHVTVSCKELSKDASDKAVTCNGFLGLWRRRENVSRV